MNFCSSCGARVHLGYPPGDNRKRYICERCETIHYENPRIVAGTLTVSEDGRVLLCKRAIEPRLGYWTLPAGFMENAESTEAAALRETQEEACADVSSPALYAVLDLPHINQVYMIFRGALASDFAAGPESQDVALFAEDEIPWDQIAFATVTKTLQYFFEDRRQGQFPLHRHTLTQHK